MGIEVQIDKSIEHEQVCLELNDLYKRKNKDYGDSFSRNLERYGLCIAAGRLYEKLDRFDSLIRSGQQEIKEESVRDTLIDLANYAIITVMEMDIKKAAKEEPSE